MFIQALSVSAYTQEHLGLQKLFIHLVLRCFVGFGFLYVILLLALFSLRDVVNLFVEHISKGREGLNESFSCLSIFLVSVVLTTRWVGIMSFL